MQRHISRQAKGELNLSGGTPAQSAPWHHRATTAAKIPPKDGLSVLVEGQNRRARDFTLTHLAARVSALGSDQEKVSRCGRHHFLDNDHRSPVLALVRRRNVIEDDVVDEGLKDEPCPGRCVHNDRLLRGRRQVHAK